MFLERQKTHSWNASAKKKTTRGMHALEKNGAYKPAYQATLLFNGRNDKEEKNTSWTRDTQR